mmetsp:Transcript_4089/g.5736  ORF Transcript_4089/g.5736 Transcript_4089/m.5736 type:complete len:264 (+) Transcript_4089:85-876(+)
MEESKEESFALIPSGEDENKLAVISSEERKEEWQDPAKSATLRKHAVRMDGLDYMESYPAQERRRIDEMIESEMTAMATEGIIADPVSPIELSARAIDRGENMEGSFSLERYSCEPPKDSTDDKEWVKAVNNVSAQLENQTNRVLNLELLETFGEAAWRRHIQDLQGLKLQLETLVSAKRRKADAINVQRKTHQESISPHILHYEASYNSALHHHLELRLANTQLEQQILRIEALLTLRGIPYPAASSALIQPHYCGQEDDRY